MADEHRSSAFIVSIAVVWLLFGLFIFLTNTATTVLMWRTKKARQKAHPGVYPHGMWNLLAMDLAFASFGFILTLNSLTALSVESNLPNGVCDFFGFTIRFVYGFATITILVNLVDKIYCLWRPFRYHSFVRGRSRFPLVYALCCLIYGFINAFFPLVNYGEYRERFSTCIMAWDDQSTTQFVAFLNLVLAMVIFGCIFDLFLLRYKLLQNRRQLKVALSRPRETIMFVLAISCLFSICWIPGLIAMFILIYGKDIHLGDGGKATLFGLKLIPLIINLFLTYGLHGYFREQCDKALDSLKKVFPFKMKVSKMSANDVNADQSKTGSTNTVKDTSL